MRPEKNVPNHVSFERPGLSLEELQLWHDLRENISDELRDIQKIYITLSEGSELPLGIRDRLATILTRPTGNTIYGGNPLWDIVTFGKFVNEIEVWPQVGIHQFNDMLENDKRFVEDISRAIIRWFEELDIRKLVQNSVGPDSLSTYSRGDEYWHYTTMAELLASYTQNPDTFEYLIDVSPFSKNEPYWQADFRGTDRILKRLIFEDVGYFEVAFQQVKEQIFKEQHTRTDEGNMLSEIRGFLSVYHKSQGGQWGERDPTSDERVEKLTNLYETSVDQIGSSFD
jgi:hypothetical protein